MVQPWTRFVPNPWRPDGRPEFRQAEEISVRKSVFKSQPTDVISVSPQAIACPFPRLISDLRRKYNVNDYSALSS